MIPAPGYNDIQEHRLAIRVKDKQVCQLMFLLVAKHASRNLPILASISLSVPPSLLTILPEFMDVLSPLLIELNSRYVDLAMLTENLLVLNKI